MKHRHKEGEMADDAGITEWSWGVLWAKLQFEEAQLFGEFQDEYYVIRFFWKQELKLLSSVAKGER